MKPPREVEPITVPVKQCCGVLTSDVCDCAAWAAEVVAAFANPIRWHVPVEGEATR